MKVKYPEIGKTYQHYKGGKYKVISMAKHTETDEVLVIYQSIHWGSYHARPLDSWNSDIEEKSKAGIIELNQRRFTLIEE